MQKFGNGLVTGGWHFVTLDKNYQRKFVNNTPKGFGANYCYVGKKEWAASLFPHTPNKSQQTGLNIYCINKKILKKKVYLGMR